MAFITRGFRKFYKKNAKNFRKKSLFRNSKDSSRRKKISKDELFAMNAKDKVTLPPIVPIRNQKLKANTRRQ